MPNTGILQQPSVSSIQCADCGSVRGCGSAAIINIRGCLEQVRLRMRIIRRCKFPISAHIQCHQVFRFGETGSVSLRYRSIQCTPTANLGFVVCWRTSSNNDLVRLGQSEYIKMKFKNNVKFNFSCSETTTFVSSSFFSIF